MDRSESNQGPSIQAADVLGRLEYLARVGIALSKDKGIDRLLETILIGAKTITPADGGTLYRVEEQRRLRFEIVRTDSLDFALGGATGKPIPFAPLALYDERGHPNSAMIAAHAAVQGVTVNIADACAALGFDFSGTRAFDQHTGYRTKSVLTVPMRNHEDEIVGVLQLINAIDPLTGATVP